jgi:PRTRC genetic system protein C
MSQHQPDHPERIFKIGDVLIVEDASQSGMTNEDVRDVLAFQYPEVANATITTSEQQGRLIVEFVYRPGRKG